jgi:hypothetical protein
MGYQKAQDVDDILPPGLQGIDVGLCKFDLRHPFTPLLPELTIGSGTDVIQGNSGQRQVMQIKLLQRLMNQRPT